jgi:hypothetical protein
LNDVPQYPHPLGVDVCGYVLLFRRMEWSVTKLLYPVGTEFPQITPVPLLKKKKLNWLPVVVVVLP